MRGEPDQMLRTLALVEAAMDDRLDDVIALLEVSSIAELSALVIDLMRYAAGATTAMIAVTDGDRDRIMGGIRAELIDRQATGRWE